ncbi:MAG: AURKAIP1/COX24 domain-containing protein [Thermodesulfovibrionia bacterium]
MGSVVKWRKKKMNKHKHKKLLKKSRHKKKK